MAQHVKILGVLNIVFGAMGVLGAIVVLLIFGGLSAVGGLSDNAPNLPLVGVISMGAIGGFVFILILVLSLPSLITGIGLVQFRPWGRVLGIVMSALHLFNIPFGTALGIYGLWVLLNRETEQMFARPVVRVG